MKGLISLLFDLKAVVISAKDLLFVWGVQWALVLLELQYALDSIISEIFTDSHFNFPIVCYVHLIQEYL